MKTAEKELRELLELKKAGKGNINYSIKAGAGGGKTTLLSKRICEQIVAGTPIEEFVVITYTNAAAAELRDKISDRLREVISSGKCAGDELKNAREALNSIELMQISTIHAFLLKILREYAFETGIVLDARMLEEEEDSERKERFFNNWYHKNFAEIQKFREDWTVTSQKSKKDNDYSRDVLKNMFFDIANVREEIVYDVSDHSADFEKMAQDYVAAWLPKLVIFKNAVMANRPNDKKGNPKNLNKDPQTMVDCIAEVEGATNIGCTEAVTLSKAVGIIKSTIEDGKSFYGAAGDNTPLLGVIPDVPDYELEWDFKTLYDKYLSWSQKSAKVVGYVCKMQKEYQKEIDQEAMSLSNDDILYRAKELLSKHPEVLDKLRETYTKMYVDEFQDTTGLQASLVNMLSEKVGASGGTNDLQADKLIVVGDPKQSIYRFTGAEKAVYDSVDAMMAGMPASVAESVSLDTNFRSNKDVIDWVNNSFSKLMPTGYSPMDTDWTIAEKNALHGVYKYEPNLGMDANGKALKYKRNNDVDAVVNLVEELVDNPHCFVEQPVRRDDGSFDTPILRKIKYSDIMIICKVTTNIKDYVEKFSEAGIPVNVQGKFKVDGDVVLRNFALVTEYLAGYKNKKKRITAAQIISGIDASSVDVEELKKVEEELRELRSYFREHDMDTAAIMSYLLTREELFLPKGEVQNLERVREYRIRLHQMVENCIEKNDGDISKFSDLMNEYIEKDIKREIPLESNENAVRLMNVHQSKGLTGQIVIIADRAQKEGCRYTGFKKAGKYYPTVSYKVSSESAASLFPAYGWDLNMLKQAYNDEAEEAIRLQYVAATRAAHVLIIMPLVYGNTYPNAWFSDEKYRYDSLPEINEWIQDREKDTTTYSLKDDSSVATGATITLGALESNKKGADINLLTERQLVSITPSGLEPKGVTGYLPVDKGYAKEDRPGADVFGVVMHRVYELIFGRYEALKTCGDIDKAIGRIINQAILENTEKMHAGDKPKEFYTFLLPKMKDYFIKVIVPIMDEADEIYPEYTFSFYVEDAGRKAFINQFEPYFKDAKEEISIKNEPIWVNGQADLVVKKKDGSIKVYDYKSDAMNGKPVADFEASMDKKYAGQLALYRYAVGKAFGAKDVQTELIHLYR